MNVLAAILACSLYRDDALVRATSCADWALITRLNSSAHSLIHLPRHFRTWPVK